jgi:hypothetical protein
MHFVLSVYVHVHVQDHVDVDVDVVVDGFLFIASESKFAVRAFIPALGCVRQSALPDP